MEKWEIQEKELKMILEQTKHELRAYMPNDEQALYIIKKAFEKVTTERMTFLMVQQYLAQYASNVAKRKDGHEFSKREFDIACDMAYAYVMRLKKAGKITTYEYYHKARLEVGHSKHRGYRTYTYTIHCIHPLEVRK